MLICGRSCIWWYTKIRVDSRFTSSSEVNTNMGERWWLTVKSRSPKSFAMRYVAYYMYWCLASLLHTYWLTYLHICSLNRYVYSTYATSVLGPFPFFRKNNLYRSMIFAIVKHFWTIKSILLSAKSPVGRLPQRLRWGSPAEYCALRWSHALHVLRRPAACLVEEKITTLEIRTQCTNS